MRGAPDALASLGYPPGYEVVSLELGQRRAVGRRPPSIWEGTPITRQQGNDTTEIVDNHQSQTHVSDMGNAWEEEEGGDESVPRRRGGGCVSLRWPLENVWERVGVKAWEGALQSPIRSRRRCWRIKADTLGEGLKIEMKGSIEGKGC